MVKLVSMEGPNMSSPSATKVQIMGTEKILYGFDSDPYFSNANSHIANNQALISQIVRLGPQDTFIDIGANLGGTTLLASVTGARIIAVEASPINAKLFRQTIAANNIQVDFFECAVGDGDGVVRFEEDAFAAGSHVSSSGAVEVQVRPLDSILSELEPDSVSLIKIDVEGYEYEVLNGSATTLNKYKPKVVMEFNSYAISMHTNRSPRLLAELVLDISGSFVVDSEHGYVVHNTETLKHFIYQNMASGCVNDIIWTPR